MHRLIESAWFSYCEWRNPTFNLRGVENNEAERGKPRHEPPLRFVPNKSLDNEDGEDKYNKLITAELNQKTTIKVVPYVFIDVESYLGYQKQHMYILD